MDISIVYVPYITRSIMEKYRSDNSNMLGSTIRAIPFKYKDGGTDIKCRKAFLLYIKQGWKHGA